MIDHIMLGVTDVDRSVAFYDAVLGSLGIAKGQHGAGAYAGYGVGEELFFWFHHKDVVATGTHVAFVAPDRATVDRFHAAALAAGGRDNGGPGLRPQYHADYYGAFVLDLDGHNIEAVCHKPA